MTTIGEIFAYHRILPYKGLRSPAPVADEECLVGVEIELEQVVMRIIPSTWRHEHDGSLKDNGAEFVSNPIQLCYLDVELRRLLGGLQHSATSTRCSIHVHINVRDLTEEELHKFIMLYSIFERCLFRISGDRWKNNYCVPITSTPEMVKRFITQPYRGWHKYLALNLAPIYGDQREGSKKYGTVEFRHHAGCNDADKILEWCNVIVSLKKAAQFIALEDVVGHIKIMNTDSTYYAFAERIFGRWSQLLTLLPTFKEDVEGCITKSKHIFFNITGELISFRTITPVLKVDDGKPPTTFDEWKVRQATLNATNIPQPPIRREWLQENTQGEFRAVGVNDIGDIIIDELTNVENPFFEQDRPVEFDGDEEELEGDF